MVKYMSEMFYVTQEILPELDRYDGYYSHECMTKLESISYNPLALRRYFSPEMIYELSISGRSLPTAIF